MCFAFLQLCIDLSWSGVLLFTRRWGLYDRLSSNLLRDDRAPILVSSDCGRNSFSHWTWVRLQILQAQHTLTNFPRNLIYYSWNPKYLCATFLWPLRFGSLLVVGRYKEDYLHFLMCVLLIVQLLRLLGRLGTRNRFNYTQLIADYTSTPTDHPKSVRNCCVIEIFFFALLYMCCHFAFLIFCWYRDFVATLNVKITRNV